MLFNGIPNLKSLFTVVPHTGQFVTRNSDHPVGTSIHM